MSLSVVQACRTAVLLLPILTGCKSWETNRGKVCVSVAKSGSAHRLYVRAEGPDCSGDHEGAELKCEVGGEGRDAVITTQYHAGKDPNDGCFGAVRATCGRSVPEGVVTVSFGGDVAEITVPGGLEVCLPEGSELSDSGW